MSRKRNDYLELSDEEDIALRSEEEDARDSRLTSLKNKRRKLNHSDEDEVSDRSDNDAASFATAQTSEAIRSHGEHDGIEGEGEGKVSEERKNTVSDTAPLKKSKTISRVLTPAELEASQRKVRKSGVVYLSRIPPFMKPSTVRHLLAPFGEVSRLFLTPEPPAHYKARVKSGGNKKRSFTEGWLEFTKKREAKTCVELLNGNIIGGKKGGFYHDDIWSMKYLQGFKWNDLMEQVAADEREREGRLRAEIARETRERKEFLTNIEQSKRLNGMEAKNEKKKGKEGEDTAGVDGALIETPATTSVKQQLSRRRQQTFRQNPVKAPTERTKASEQPEDVRRVLSRIF